MNIKKLVRAIGIGWSFYKDKNTSCGDVVTVSSGTLLPYVDQATAKKILAVLIPPLAKTANVNRVADKNKHLATYVDMRKSG